MFFSCFKKIEHKLDLILQKNKIDSSLEFYDDGHIYHVYITDVPDYYPRTIDGELDCLY